MSGSAFTALVNSFVVSLIALIPGTSLGFTAAIMSVVSLHHTVRLTIPAAAAAAAAAAWFQLVSWCFSWTVTVRVAGDTVTVPVFSLITPALA